jgi:ribose transport system substrate-binding protein
MQMTKWLAGALAAGLIMSAATAIAQTVGPAGEAATPSADVALSDADIAALKDKGYKAALLWHTSSDFTNAVGQGATDEFKRAGI